MAMTEKIKILLIKKNLSAVELANKLNCSPTNIYNKFKRDNFSEKELREIATVLGVEYYGNFKIPETGETI